MNYSVIPIDKFKKEVKRLIRKYPSLKNDLAALIKELTDEPEQGTALGNNFYKIRLAITAKGKGKSGGARVITYVKVIATTVYLSAIYDKGEKSTITDNELKNIFKTIP